MLQPENIVITEKGGKDIKIIDLGTALKLHPDEKVVFSIIERSKNFYDQVQAMVGTAEFVAPEVVNYDDISINTGKVTSAHDDNLTKYSKTNGPLEW